MPSVLEMYRSMSKLPQGERLFSMAFSRKAPYFATVKPRFIDLRANYAELVIAKRRAVHNHIGTVHAIAVCNGLEMAMGALAEASVPDHKRWLPKGMSVAYVAKAETGLRAVAEVAELPRFGDEGFDLEVPVMVTDKSGKPVVTATITIWVTKKKK